MQTPKQADDPGAALSFEQGVVGTSEHRRTWLKGRAVPGIMGMAVSG